MVCGTCNAKRNPMSQKITGLQIAQQHYWITERCLWFKFLTYRGSKSMLSAKACSCCRRYKVLTRAADISNKSTKRMDKINKFAQIRLKMCIFIGPLIYNSSTNPYLVVRLFWSASVNFVRCVTTITRVQVTNYYLKPMYLSYCQYVQTALMSRVTPQRCILFEIFAASVFFCSFYYIEFPYLIFLGVFASTSVMVKVWTKSFYVSDGTLVCNI